MKFPFRLLNVLCFLLIGLALCIMIAQKLPEMFVWFPATSDAVSTFAGVLFGVWLLASAYDNIEYLFRGGNSSKVELPNIKE